MDNQDIGEAWALQPTESSKRPSPTPEHDGRQQKRSRTQPHDGEYNQLCGDFPLRNDGGFHAASVASQYTNDGLGVHIEEASVNNPIEWGPYENVYPSLPDLPWWEQPSTQPIDSAYGVYGIEPGMSTVETSEAVGFYPGISDVFSGPSAGAGWMTESPVFSYPQADLNYRAETQPFHDLTFSNMQESNYQDGPIGLEERLSKEESDERGLDQVESGGVESDDTSESSIGYIGHCSEYDTCFGVIVATPTSSFRDDKGEQLLTVNLKPVGGRIILLEDQESGQHAGILSGGKLVQILEAFDFKLNATLLISEVIGNEGPKKKRNVSKKETVCSYSLRLALHGLLEDKLAIGDLLSQAGLFLQHPRVSEVVPGICYDNPHYLVRPGAQMPKLEDLQLSAGDRSRSEAEEEDELQSSRFLQLFETAGADGNTTTIENISQSERLRSTLMRHQITALAMMLEKEAGVVESPVFPALWEKEVSKGTGLVRYRHTITRSLESKPTAARGGILADDMGLGKTLSIIALICSSLDLELTTSQNTPSGTEPRGTLIVAPKSTLHGWKGQILEHVHPDKIKTPCIYHGAGRGSIASTFRNVDIVITTYETLRSEWADGNGKRPLFSWKWLRVVLDEAHHIRNRSKQAFKSVHDLSSRYRWCLTGTPIHNSLDDFGALLSFVRVNPFEEKSKFTSWITKPVEEERQGSIERLQHLIRATSLRRTKGNTLVSIETCLPPRSEKEQTVVLHEHDRHLYDKIKALATERLEAKNISDERMPTAKGTQKENVLLLINSLRSVCNDGQHLLSPQMRGVLAKGSTSTSKLAERHYQSACQTCGGEVTGDGDGSIVSSQGQEATCASCASSEETSPTSKKKHPARNNRTTGKKDNRAHYQPSAKVDALLKNLEQDRIAISDTSYSPRKSVVFTFWVKFLDLIEQALLQNNIGFQRIDGSVSFDRRGTAMQTFIDDPNCTVMLASIGSAAEGIHLTAANVVHLMEPHWNPQVEAQAIDRVYRIGQTKPVEVIRYIIPDSIEKYVQEVQREKLQMINRAMGTHSMTKAEIESKKWKRIREFLDLNMSLSN